MTGLFVDVFVFVFVAFLLGAAVGWLLWRFRRVPVEQERWHDQQRRVDALERQQAQVAQQREALRRQVEHLEAELGRVRHLLAEAWHDRDELRLRRDELVSSLADANAGLERESAQSRYLQRRVTELSILAARRAQGERAGDGSSPARSQRPSPSSTTTGAASSSRSGRGGNGASPQGGRDRATPPRPPADAPR